MDTVLLALRVLLSLGVVLGLLWMMQRRVSRGSRAKNVATPITVIGRQRLGAKASVVVVQLQGKTFMLGVTEQSVNVLHAETGMATPVPLSTESAADEFARSMRSASSNSASSPASVSPAASSPTSSDRSADPADHAADDTAEDHAAPLLRPRRGRVPGSLGGSILSPTTWKQTADVLRQRR